LEILQDLNDRGLTLVVVTHEHGIAQLVTREPACTFDTRQASRKARAQSGALER